MRKKTKEMKELDAILAESDRYYRKNKKRLDREAAEFERKRQEDELERARSYVEDPLSKVQRGMCSDDEKCEGLDNLIGGQVVDIGFMPWTQEGGMAIDYVKDGKTMRMIFGYTELGLWVEWQGEIKLSRKECSKPDHEFTGM